MLEKNKAANKGKLTVSIESSKILLKRGLAESACGRGFVFTRDLRLLSRYLILPYISLPYHSTANFQQFSRNITCPHLLVKAKDGPYYHNMKVIEETLDIYRENPKFEYHLVDGFHHVHLCHPEVTEPIIKNFVMKYFNDNTQ